MALASTVLLWRIYFHLAGRVLGVAIGRARNSFRLATEMAFTHLAMIAGIVLTGVGFELIITEPHTDFPATWLLAILGGPALFLAGRSVLEFQVFARVSLSRKGGLLALGLLAPATLHLPALAAGAAVTIVLFGVAGADTRRSHHRPVEEPAPPG
ncbi:low temperature requirement protein A [Plantactinospora sp. S1510]|uniref:Low temperature requirement protein A n=1 Tax=Plantactinospora alkalitolerans TaxID=2789879 RepID=A0ABS0GTC0_9ACTN|nr:low temperature requirement protein A [Plantactinospora alkalitolerans]MBF9129441.1 low temperature requirement protein A [Plantactinospora alkalitolerans]